MLVADSNLVRSAMRNCVSLRLAAHAVPKETGNLGRSTGNQLLALMHCNARSIQPGPMQRSCAGRNSAGIRKAEKVLTLCMPVTCKAKYRARDQHGQETEQDIA